MYTVKEIFLTLQGEGGRTGEKSVFLRFAGCNLWSGREEDRQRGPGPCSAWCDTDFLHGDRMSAEEIEARMSALWPKGDGQRWVVCTGGEPALQLDADLVGLLKLRGWLIAVESNGTLPLPLDLDWVTLSPKRGAPLLAQFCSEMKVVLPGGMVRGWSDAEVLELGERATQRRFVQPQAGPNYESHLRRCVDFVMAHPTWRLSLQTHKLAGLP